MPEENQPGPAHAEAITSTGDRGYPGSVPLEPDEHPVLDLARESAKNVEAIAEFFNPVEKYFGPHEPEDWPRDMTAGELAQLVPRLNEILANLSWAIGNLVEQEIQADAELSVMADPEKLRQLTGATGLLDQAHTAIQAGETLFSPPQNPGAARTPQEIAAQSFPQGRPALPAPGTAGQRQGPRPGTAPGAGLQHRPKGPGA